jgi:hypothetical protein
MGVSTFSGPIKAGSIKEGASKNTGFVVMAQTAAFAQSTTAANTGITIPAGSQLLEIQFNVTAAPGTANISAGTSATATELFSGLAAGTSANVMLFGTAATITDGDAWADVGTSDVSIWLDWSGAGSGAGFVTVSYLQAIDLA